MFAQNFGKKDKIWAKLYICLNVLAVQLQTPIKWKVIIKYSTVSINFYQPNKQLLLKITSWGSGILHSVLLVFRDRRFGTDFGPIWHLTQLSLVVSYRRWGTGYGSQNKGQIETIGRLQNSVTANQLNVISNKKEHFICTTAQAINHKKLQNSPCLQN